MDWFTIVYFLTDLLADESKHFMLAFAMGLLGYSAIWIMFSVFSWTLARLTRRTVNTAVGRGIQLCSLLAGLSLALLSHWALDYWVVLYTMPLGAPLELIVR